MMRKVAALALVVSAAALLSACGGGGNSLLNRDRPDEMAVTRAAPLVVPPDFSLTPPNPGSPRPQDTDTGRKALDALFGGPSARSGIETDSLNRAGTAATSIRSPWVIPKRKPWPRDRSCAISSPRPKAMVKLHPLRFRANPSG